MPVCEAQAQSHASSQIAAASCCLHAIRAFSLIEVIGVLSILAILALALVSTTTRQMDITAGNLERTNLVKFANALQTSILRNRYLPGANDMVPTIANELGLDAADVSINARRLPRLFLIDPAIQVGSNSGGLPYRQPFTGSVVTSNSTVIRPPNARLMIVSTLGAPFNAVLTNAALSKTDFQNIWTAADGNVPAWFASNGWSGRGDDLKVERVNLASLFVQLVLFNYPPPQLGNTNQGLYAIDRTGTHPVGFGANGVQAFFLRNSILGLYDSKGNLQAEQILSYDGSFVYLNQVWRGSLNFQNTNSGSYQSSLGSAFEAAAAAFVSSPYNSLAYGGVTPPVVINDISNFFAAYVNWSSLTPPPNSGLIYNSALNYQRAMINDMVNLVSGSATSGKNGLTARACTNAPTQ